MTNQTTTTEQAARALATILRRADAAHQRAQQLQGYFQNRHDSAGFLAAIETVRSSHLVDLAEDALYRELQEYVAKAAELGEGRPLTTEQTFEVVERFTKRLASAARRAVEADSSSFMSNALAVARHNAILRVLEVLEECVEEAHGATH